MTGDRVLSACDGINRFCKEYFKRKLFLKLCSLPELRVGLVASLDRMPLQVSISTQAILDEVKWGEGPPHS